MERIYSKLGKPITRRNLLKLSAGFVGLAAVVACNPVQQPAATPAPGSPQPGPAQPPAAAPTQAPAVAGAPKTGGTLSVVIQNDWVSLDPLYNSAEPNGTNMIYGEWIKWQKDASGQWGPHPEMIAEWDLKPDQVVFKLQKGIKFHDGTAWDAKAAKWNFDRMIFDPASTMVSFFGAVDTSAEDSAELEKVKATAGQTFDFSSKAVEVVDDLTVKLHLKSPAGGILSALSNSNQYNNPVSPTAYKRLGKKDFGRNPVGAGPFRFVEWKPGSGVLLERNPDYWKKDANGGQLPYLDRIQYRLIIDDSVRLLEVKSGNAHFMELVQGKDIAGVKADPKLVFLESAASGNQYRLIFDSTNQDSPFYKSKKLRQAALYAIDREAMMKTLGFGSGSGRQYLLPKGSFAYDESVPYYWYDKAKAEQLAKEALSENQSLAGSDGKVAATLSVIQREVDKMQAEMIKQMLDSVGFKITIEVLERAAWTAKLVKMPGQPGGKHDFATMRNPVLPDDPSVQWGTYFYSKGSFNVAHLNDPAWDTRLESAERSYDIEERKKMYRQLAQVAYDDPWYGWLWQQNWNWLHSSKVKGFNEVPMNRWIFTETWID